MKTKLFALAFCFVASLIFNGCGALFKGTTQKIQVNSHPQGSMVNVDGVEYTSPVSIELQRNKSHVVTISKDGYKTEKIAINRTVSGGIVVLDVLGGVVPLIIDAAMGTWYNLEPKTINVTLRSNETGLSDIPINFMASEDGAVKITAPEPVKIAIEVIDPDAK